MTTDLVERRYLSQYSTETVGVIVNVAGVPTDPDNNAVRAVLSNEVTQAVVADRAATQFDTGQYGIVFDSAETSAPGMYVVEFTYTINGVFDSYVLHLEIGSTAPAYDALPFGMKDIVEQVWLRFADLFDSPYGGPHLQVYMQSNFNRNRLAMLLRQAVGRLNTIAQPFSTYTVDQPFPYDQWGPLLVQALYVEVLKHLRRSYVEQPEVMLGTSISRTDRRDYMDRWGAILVEEQADLERMLSGFKMANMGLGGGSVLVSGGIFGRYGAGWGATPGLMAARGYFVARRY